MSILENSTNPPHHPLGGGGLGPGFGPNSQGTDQPLCRPGSGGPGWGWECGVTPGLMELSLEHATRHFLLQMQALEPQIGASGLILVRMASLARRKASVDQEEAKVSCFWVISRGSCCGRSESMLGWLGWAYDHTRFLVKCLWEVERLLETIINWPMAFNGSEQE